MNFLKKNKMQNKIKKPKPEKFQLEPEPNKKHFICQICKKIPRIEFISLNKFNYTCNCHVNEHLNIIKGVHYSITFMQNKIIIY